FITPLSHVYVVAPLPVNVRLSPSQIVISVLLPFASAVTFGIGFTSIRTLRIAGTGFAQAKLELTSTETTSLWVYVVGPYELVFPPTGSPVTYHWYCGVSPQLVNPDL